MALRVPTPIYGLLATAYSLIYGLVGRIILSFGEIAVEVGASERTVRRDISELQDAGFDIELTTRDAFENRDVGVEVNFVPHGLNCTPKIRP